MCCFQPSVGKDFNVFGSVDLSTFRYSMMYFIKHGIGHAYANSLTHRITFRALFEQYNITQLYIILELQFSGNEMIETQDLNSLYDYGIIMVMHMTISIPQYVWDRTVAKNPRKNRSEWISELLLEGIEAYEKKCKDLKIASDSDASKGP